MTVSSDLPAHPSGVDMQHYVDARIEDQRCGHERQHEIERELAREARDTLAAVLAAKFESQNEWRASMSDLTMTYMPRDSFDRQHDALAEKLELRAKQLSERVDAIEDQATRSAIIVGVVSGILGLLAGALIIPVVGHFFSG
jgi:hypothetical protein